MGNLENSIRSVSLTPLTDGLRLHVHRVCPWDHPHPVCPSVPVGLCTELSWLPELEAEDLLVVGHGWRDSAHCTCPGRGALCCGMVLVSVAFMVLDFLNWH